MKSLSLSQAQIITGMNNAGMAISFGQIAGTGHIDKFGTNPTIGTTAHTVWFGDGISADYVFPTAASVMKISSASTNDTSAGTGARTVHIAGLDVNYLEIDETITMNGQTAVNSTKSYLRIHRMKVVTAGTLLTNAGIIYAGTGDVTTGKPAVRYSSIPYANGQGSGQTANAFYTVPANKTAYLQVLEASLASNKVGGVIFQVRPFGEAFQAKHFASLYQGTITKNFLTPQKIEAKSDIRVQAFVGSTTGAFSASFEMLLIDD